MLNYHRAWLAFSAFVSVTCPTDGFPHSEDTVEMYVAHLATTNSAVGVIKNALSAIAWHHKSAKQPDPTKSFMTRRILVTLSRAAPAPKKADPISLAMLENCLGHLRELGLSPYESVLLKSLLLIMYYGCLRVGEVTLSTNPDNVLKLACTEFISLGGTRHFKFTLTKFKHSKGPETRCIPPNPLSGFCPVESLSGYFRARPRGGTPCFVLADASPVPRLFVADALTKLFGISGYKEGNFSTHSLRAGRATDLAAAGGLDAEIRAAGRWSSDAFKGYLRFPILPVVGGL